MYLVPDRLVFWIEGFEGVFGEWMRKNQILEFADRPTVTDLPANLKNESRRRYLSEMLWQFSMEEW